MLYDVIISPLVYLIELVFSLGYKLTGSAGLAIIAVSLAVNLLCLPLYRMADAAQDAERERQKSMKKWVDHINGHFSGDERVMMLQAYYRLRHYHPAQAMIGSLSLLLQIPFFMAAYTYLSELVLLRGSSFLFLSNLGAPDALISLGGHSLNVMPILMTALNCASTIIYTRGLPLRDKVQAYGLALVFLVLLYSSPSGLVFYWTCNQLFSFGKNIFMKVIPEPRKRALELVQICVTAATAILVVSGKIRTVKRGVAVVVALVVFEALWLRAFRSSPDDARESMRDGDRRRVTLQFLAGGILLSVLLGLLIPSALIGDSPTEFMVGNASPLRYVLHTSCVWSGVFLFWWGVYFALSDDESRKMHALASWLLCGVVLLDYFAFGRGLGTITANLAYDGGVKYSTTEQLINLAAIVVVVAVLYVLWRWRGRLALPITCIIALSLATMSVLNVRSIADAVAKERIAREETASDLRTPDGGLKQILHLSKTNRNVVVLFLDRALSGLLPYVMAERPELVAQFDGFTYYPNTVSHGWFTNFGAPGLYGGYEYTPAAMNARSDESIPDKHNEALLLMPTLMSEAGYRTTVLDPPYAGNYQWDIDVSLYDDLENTEAYATNGAYTHFVQERLGIGPSAGVNRKFVYYAAFKVVPEVFQRRIYDKGNYLSVEKNSYPRSSLMDALSVLELLPELTDVDSKEGGFLLLCNNTTHEHGFLQLPDYEMAQKLNNSGLEDMSRFELDGRVADMSSDYELMHYHVNAAALIRLGRWFDWMREQGVYDNTRIIIVSDHGRDLHVFDDWIIDDSLNLMMVNPLLMVKDFNATGFKTTDEFMTNADTPTLAMTNVLENPVNPFTGKAVTNDEKTLHDQLITLSMHWRVGTNNGMTFDTSDAPWYSVHDDIFNKDNWTRYETYEDAVEAVPQ